MALLINNESPQNIVYNGNEVLKVIYNNVVVWEKQSEQQVYKRRIMVGDNLYQVKISSDYPENFYEVFPNNPIQEIFINTSGGDMSFQTTVLNYSYGSLVISSFGDRLKDWYESSSENVTTYGNQETIFGNSIPVSERNNYNVTEIVNNENSNSYLAQAYRHLFIEDPNIRPIQVGDKIIAGTRIYFTYPDNYYNQWAADGTYNDAVLIQLGINEEDVYKSFYHARYSSGAMSVSLDFFDSFSGSSKYIYDTDDSGNVLTNISYVEFTQDEGEVTFVDPYNFEKIIKHILVDTTTLGE